MPSNQHTLRMIYTPPEECEGLSCKCSFKFVAFSLQTEGSGWPVLKKRKHAKSDLQAEQNDFFYLKENNYGAK